MLATLLRQPWQVRACETFTDWWSSSSAVRAQWPDTVQRAVALGFGADRLAWAFGGGYSSALHALDPSLPDEPASLCATEDGGGHPKAILAKLEEGRVTGTKRFVSFGAFARTLLVVANENGPLRVVKVRADAPGVRVEPGVELPFVPEVPHASVVLDGAPGEVLPGDGYDVYLKPFRTIEDLHVSAAVAGYVLSLSLRQAWPQSTSERALGVVSACLGVSREWSAPVTHLSVAAVLAQVDALVAQLPLDPLAPELLRFSRDLPLLRVAGKAREARRVRAWSTLSPPAPAAP